MSEEQEYNEDVEAVDEEEYPADEHGDYTADENGDENDHNTEYAQEEEGGHNNSEENGAVVEGGEEGGVDDGGDGGGGDNPITHETNEASAENEEHTSEDVVLNLELEAQDVLTNFAAPSSFMDSMDSPDGQGWDGYGDEYDDDEYYDEGEWDESGVEEGQPKKRKGPKNTLGKDFMDHTWKKPDKELSAKRGKAGLWQGGERTFNETSVSDFGEMSDGMELYFYVLRAFAGLFFILTLLSLPALIISAGGNGGLGGSADVDDPSNLSRFAIGNLGYNRDATLAKKFCRDQEGENSCVTTRYIFGLEVAAKYVTFVISGYEAIISVTMIVISTWLVMRIEQKADEIDEDSSTPADFTVFVRNLPKDVSEGALVAHFSMRYALTYEQPEFPVLGLSQFGACFTLGFIAALVISAVAGTSLTSVVGVLGPLASPVVLLLLTAMFTMILLVCGVGKPKDRLTPAQRWDEMEEARNQHRAYMEEEREQYRLWEEQERAARRQTRLSQRASAKPGQVVPILDDEQEESKQDDDGGGGGGGSGGGEKPSVKFGQVLPISDEQEAAMQEEEPEEGIEMVDKDVEEGGGGGGDDVEGGAPGEEVTDEGLDQTYSEGGEGGEGEQQQTYSEGGEGGEQQQTYSEGGGEGEEQQTNSENVDSSPTQEIAPDASDSNEGVIPFAKALNLLGDDEDEDEDIAPQKRCGCCGCCCCGKELTPEEAFEGMDKDGLSPDLPRPDPQPVSSCLHNGYPPVLGSWVADLHIVYPNGSIISSYLKQRALDGKIQGMRSKIQQFKDDTPYEKGANPKKVEKFTKKLEKLQKKMDKVHEKVAKKIKDTRKAADCEGCFITFNHEESQQRCLEDYRASSSWYGRFFQPRHLRFMWHSEDPNTGVKKQTLTSIRVEQAPEPSAIFWEKLHVTDTSRLLRVFGSNLVTLIVLLLSFIVALISADQTAKAQQEIASTANCNLIPAIWYGQFYNHTVGDLWNTGVTKWVRNQTKDIEVCGGKGTYIVNEEFEWNMEYDKLPNFRTAPFGHKKYSSEKIPRPRSLATLPSSYEAGVDINGQTMCDDVCHYSGATAKYVNRTGCVSLSCNPGLTNWEKLGYPCFEGDTYYPPSAVANCYCSQQYYANFGTLLSEDAALCADYYDVLNNANFYSFMSIATVVVVNGAAKPIIKAMVAFEKQVSVSAEKKALVSKMFSLQFLNTAIITLLVNTAYSGKLGPFEMIGVGKGEYDDFNMNWYINVGAPLCLTMLIQAFSPHGGPIAKSFVVGPLKKKLLSGSASTQEKLDELYEGPEFEIEARSAFTGVALVVSMMYSAGMPILNFFGLINFSLSFAIDKYLLIKKYQQPPMYGPAVPKVLVNLLPIGTFVHMGVGLYMLSNANILYGPDVTGDVDEETENPRDSNAMLRLLIPRIVRFHSLCMFFIFVAYSGLFVLHLFGLLDEFAEEAGHFAEKLNAKFCGNKLAKQAAAARTLDHPEPPRPAYTDPYIAHLTKAQNETFVKTGKLSKSDRRRGFKLIKGDDLMVKKLHAKDGEVNGVLRKKGEPKFTWEHIKDTTAYNYDIGLIRKYKAALNGIKSNNLPNPSRRSRLEDADKEDRYALTLENIGSLTEIIYDTEEEAEEPAVGGEGEEVGGDVVPVEGSGEGGEVQPLEGAEAVVSGERQEEATDAAVTEVEGSAADRPPDDGTGDDAAQLPVDGTDKQVEEGGEEVQPEEEEVAEEEEEVEPEPEPEPEMSEEEKAAAKAQEELLAKLAAEEAEMLAKLAEEEAARQAEEEAAAAKLAEEEAARAALEAEAAAKAAEEEAARQAADAAAKARAEEEAEYARQKALAKEAAEKQAAFEAEEAERLRIEAEEAENLVIEVDDDAEEL